MRFVIALFVALGWAYEAMAQDAVTTYKKMAPVDQYLMVDQGAEIALARSAAPESISHWSDGAEYFPSSPTHVHQ